MKYRTDLSKSERQEPERPPAGQPLAGSLLRNRYPVPV